MNDSNRPATCSENPVLRRTRVGITDNFSVTFDAVNLLDEELFQYYDGLKNRPARYYDNGSIYYLGVRFNLDGR